MESNHLDCVDCSDDHDGDQLPNVEEYKAGLDVVAKQSTTVTDYIYLQNDRYKRLVIVAVIMMMVILIIVPSSIMMHRKKDHPVVEAPDDDDPYAMYRQHDGMVNLSRFYTAVEMIRDGSYSNPKTLVYDWDHPELFTPQIRAAYWIGILDSGQVPLIPTQDFIQRYVLAVLYYTTNHDRSHDDETFGWYNKYHFLSSYHVCSWNQLSDNDHNNINHTSSSSSSSSSSLGITCNNEYEIIRIMLPNNNLYGILPSELHLLYSLEELNFYNNFLIGTIPNEYQHLENLQTLILYQNQLQDMFPTWFDHLPYLSIINVGKNKIYGTLPDTLQNVEQLSVINCDSCLLHGPLEPALLRRTTLLTAIQLGNNQLNGTISNELFNSWTHLNELDLSSNQLSGTLPYGLLMTHPELYIIDLHDNHLTGPIVNETLLSNETTTIDGNVSIVPLTKLRLLSLSNNALTGNIEKWIGYCKELRHLDLSFNSLSGSIPITIGTLTELRYLFLAMNENYTVGTIPTEIGFLTNLMDVSFQKSNRIGTIPTEFGKLSSLILLDLQHNAFQGTIPIQLGNLPAINFLLLSGNQLNGSIPEGLIMDTLDTLTIDGDHNMILSVPSMICQNKTKVRTANVNYNQLDTTSQQYCSCCHHCMNTSRTDDQSCNYFYYGNLDPTAEYNYARAYYQLNEQDALIPFHHMPVNNEPLYGANKTGNSNQDIFGNVMNSGTTTIVSDPWLELDQDRNLTDDYVESYLENEFNQIKQQFDNDDIFHFDNKKFDDAYYDDSYNDDKYGEYYENGQQNDINILDPFSWDDSIRI